MRFEANAGRVGKENGRREIKSRGALCQRFFSGGFLAEDSLRDAKSPRQREVGSAVHRVVTVWTFGIIRASHQSPKAVDNGSLDLPIAGKCGPSGTPGSADGGSAALGETRSSQSDHLRSSTVSGSHGALSPCPISANSGHPADAYSGGIADSACGRARACLSGSPPWRRTAKHRPEA
jgi:hypothetical protein